MSHRVQAYVGLIVAAFLFGPTFVVIKQAIVTLPPLAFVGWRFLLGAAVLFFFARPHGRSIRVDGIVAGALLFIGFASRTTGLASTTASNSGLITGLSVVFTSCSPRPSGTSHPPPDRGLDRSRPDHDRDVRRTGIRTGGTGGPRRS